MEITFSEAKTRDLCCCRERLVQEYGPAIGKKICSRLSLLAAATSLGDLLSTPPINLVSVDGKGCYSVALGDSYRLYFKALTPVAKRGRAANAHAEIEIIGPVPILPANGRRA